MDLFNKNNEDDFTSYPTKLETYRWYKPIIIFVLGLIITIVMAIIIFMDYRFNWFGLKK